MLFIQWADDFVKRDDDPTDTAVEAAATSSDVVAPPMKVPTLDGNPFITHYHNPLGTVFIAVGAIVGAILLGLILYYLIIGIVAGQLAKRNVKREKQEKEKYNHNAAAYGYGVTLNYMDPMGDSKVPLLRRTLNVGSSMFTPGSLLNGADNSTLNMLEVGAMSNQDLTKMFVSPTAEMQHKRAKSYTPLMLNMLFVNNLSSHLPGTPGQRHLMFVPLVYMEPNALESQLLVPGTRTGEKRKTIPSMYLEDLIDLDKQ